MQRQHIFFVGTMAVCCIIVSFFWVQQQETDIVMSTNSEQVTGGRAQVALGNTIVSAEVVRTTEERARGLSGRMTLPDGDGMLFVFSEPDRYGFWMLDMHFAIDMIWFDAELHVVDVTENATPDSYPKVFRPNTPAQYVLEVPAGFVQHHTVLVGTQAVVQNL